MTRILKRAILAALGVLAIAATGAPYAGAVSFHKPAEPVTLTLSPDGTGKAAHLVWDLAGGVLTCGSGVVGESSVGGVGTIFNEFESSFLVSVASCTFLGQEAKVTLVNCGWRFHANGEVDIPCGEGAEPPTIRVPNPVCDVSVPSQFGKKTVGYTNINAKTEVRMSQNVVGTKYTATGAGCPEAGVRENGQMTTANTILKAEKAGTITQVPIFVE
jgi:hypothetical protein